MRLEFQKERKMRMEQYVNVFEEIMAGNFTNFGKDKNVHF